MALSREHFIQGAYSPEVSESKKLELTPAEKKSVDAALNCIERYEHDSSDMGRRMVHDSEQQILSYGNKVLPYLQENLGVQLSKYAYARFYSALGEGQDLEPALDFVETSKMFNNFDLSSFHLFVDYLSRIIYELRAKDAHHPVLKKISKRLIEIAKQIEDDHGAQAFKALMGPLSLTGTDEAKHFIENPHLNHVTEELQIQYWLDNLRALPELAPYRESFGRSYPEDSSFLGGQTAPYPREREDYGAFDERSYLSTYDDPYDIPDDGLRYEASLSEEQEKKCALARQLAEAVCSSESTARPAIELHFYNFLCNNPHADDESINLEIQRMKRLARQEEEYAHETNPLPTIGIEIEIPATYLNPEKKAILTALSVPHYTERDYKRMRYLEEVNAPFSYGPWVQARIIQELAALGALPLEKTEVSGRLGRVLKDDMLSLHINFGVPTEIKKVLEEEKYENIIATLNDVLVYAFCSPERIAKRKTNTAFYLQVDDVAETKKQKKEADELSWISSGLMRLELRANEFRDFPTFRLLAESQKLAAMLFQHVKFVEDKKSSLVEQKIAYLWGGFQLEAMNIFNDYDLNLQAVDFDSKRVVSVLETTKLKAECRSLADRYTQKIGRLLQSQAELSAVMESGQAVALSKAEEYQEQTMTDSTIEEERIFTEKEALHLLQKLAAFDGFKPGELLVTRKIYNAQHDLVSLEVRAAEAAARAKGWGNVWYNYMIKGNHGSFGGSLYTAVDRTESLPEDPNNAIGGGFIAAYDEDSGWRIY